MEQKDSGSASLCRFFPSWLFLDRALVMKNKKAQGIVVFVCPAVAGCCSDTISSF